MMTIAQISLMDSSAKKIYNSLELISEFSPSVVWMSLMLLETKLDITLRLELLIGKMLSMFIGYFKKESYARDQLTLHLIIIRKRFCLITGRP